METRPSRFKTSIVLSFLTSASTYRLDFSQGMPLFRNLLTVQKQPTG